MSANRPEAGQHWRRKSDGAVVEVLSTDAFGQFGIPWVMFKGKRVTHAEMRNFVRKYEPADAARIRHEGEA